MGSIPEVKREDSKAVVNIVGTTNDPPFKYHRPWRRAEYDFWTPCIGIEKKELYQKIDILSVVFTNDSGRGKFPELVRAYYLPLISWRQHAEYIIKKLPSGLWFYQHFNDRNILQWEKWFYPMKKLPITLAEAHERNMKGIL